MSMTPTAPVASAVTPPARRVRHLTRDSLALMAFSAVTSCLLSAGFVLLIGMGR